jgi:hypothetical protein
MPRLKIKELTTFDAQKRAIFTLIMRCIHVVFRPNLNIKAIYSVHNALKILNVRQNYKKREKLKQIFSLIFLCPFL